MKRTRISGRARQHFKNIVTQKVKKSKPTATIAVPSNFLDQYCVENCEEDREENSEDEEVTEDDLCAKEPEEEPEFDVKKFQKGLASWTLASKVNHEQLNGLLHLWNNSGLPKLPSDARTILQTPRKANVELNYYYFGLKKSIEIILKSIDSDLPSSVSLILFFDGLPLSKSTQSEVWPLMYAIKEISDLQPQVVGYYYSRSKPSSTDENFLKFCNKFVDEFNLLLANGIIISNKQIAINLKFILADTPGRSLMKGNSRIILVFFSIQL